MYNADVLSGNEVELSKEILLTIGIITKNECEKLERCLKSLIPLKKELDCEIIVTDTGSTDNTVEMAKEYADKVVEFEWIDDFSAARNIGIELSQGRWFMWIDSDEWMDDAEQIVAFFNSNEHTKYNTASINFVDLFKKDKNDIARSRLVRLVKLNKEFKFEGKIHETFKLKTPTKDLEAILYHDGYMVDSENVNVGKHERNINILTSIYEDDKENINTVRYLVDQYRFSKDFEKANEFCDIGMSLIEKLNLKKDIKEAYGIHFIIQKSFNYMDMNEYNKPIELLQNINISDAKNKYRLLDINFILSASSGKLGDRESELKYSQKYIECYLEREHLDKSYLYMFFEKSNKTDIVRELLLNAIEYNKDDYEKIVNYIESVIKVQKEVSEVLALNEYISIIFTAVLRFKTYKLFRDIYNDLIKYGKVLGMTGLGIDTLENLIMNYIENYKEDVEGISAQFADAEGDTEFITLMKLISCNSKADMHYSNDIIKNMKIDKINNKYIKSELLYTLLKLKNDMEAFLEELDVFTVDGYTTFLVEREDLIETTKEHFENTGANNNVKYQYLVVSILDKELPKYRDKAEQVYSVYEEVLPSLTRNIYNTNTFSEANIELYPPVFRFGYFIEKAALFKSKNQMDESIAFIKKAVVHYPNMEFYVKALLQDIEQKVNAEADRKREFEQLAVNIKQKIYELITLGQKEEALSVVCQLQSIMPNDRELKELKSRLTSF